MKHTIHPTKTLSLVAFALLGIQGLSAQTPPPTPAVGTSPVPQCKGQHKEHRAETLKNLSEAEKEQLKADMKKIHQDPALVSARQAVKDAQTKEARQEAKQSLHAIRHDLLLKVDPSVQPILDKIQPAGPAK